VPDTPAGDFKGTVLQVTNNPLVPLYDFATPNEPIFLESNSVSIELSGQVYSGQGEVFLHFFPSPKILIKCKWQKMDPKVGMILASDDNANPILRYNEKIIPGTMVNTYVSLTAYQVSSTWRPQDESMSDLCLDTDSISRVVFHLLNFADFSGALKQDGSGRYYTSLLLQSKEFEVQLLSLSSTSGTVKTLDKQGGYGLTHVGSIMRPNGQNSSSTDVVDMLVALTHFFSFCRGFWCHPICPVGFSRSDEKVWKVWSSPKDGWRFALSWFDKHYSSHMSCLFPGFLEKWSDKDWRDCMREAIYWYLLSNDASRGIDAGVILTQAALERFAFKYCVKNSRMISARDFKSKRASDKIALLLSSLKIPVDIPSCANDLKAFALSANCVHGPHALTEIRNDLVHPESKFANGTADPLLQAWNLGLWYLELCILKICGYTEKYRNRLTAKYAGQVEPMP
jgi:hypothetical protein